MIGNPGSGKSTLLNSLIRQQQFKSGISLGRGLTSTLECFKIGNTRFYDTPGLHDIERRREAAEEITKSLRKEGTYKLFFVITLMQARLRPEDVTVIRLVMESLPESSFYNLIINQVQEEVLEIIKDDKDVDAMLLKGGLEYDKLPKEILKLPYLPELDAKKDTLIKNPQRLVTFVSMTKGVEIKSLDVKEIKIEDFEKMREQIEKDINEKLATKFEEDIRKMARENDQQRQKDRKEYLKAQNFSGNVLITF